MTTVYVLIEEHGAYSDYSMNIEGVFATPDAAKAWLTKEREARAAKHESNNPPLNRTPWKMDGETNAETCATVGSKWLDGTTWTIVPYEVQEPE